MEFTPKSNKQLKEEMLIPAGEYDFEVVKAEEKLSKSNNPMIALNLKVFVDGGTRFCNDWLMTTSAAMEFKFRHFCEATGLLDRYDSGQISAQDIQGVAGKVKIAVKDDEQYGPQNTVKDYIVPEVAAVAAAAPVAAQTAPAKEPAQRPNFAVPAHARAKPMTDDDIPF
jgi:hypothetical protein